ncbi:MAG: hypothetical protein WD768_13035 [Phycisphaeraceae bacterium]
MAILAVPAFVQAQQREDAVGDLVNQIGELRREIQNLRQENQRLQASFAQRQGGTAYPTQLFAGDRQIQVFNQPGAPAPSWLDLLIEQNRQRTMESFARARENERLADERLLRITAESRAMGTNYAPRPLREAVLAGGDPKAHRDELVSARSADFDALINQDEVKDFFRTKAARLQSNATGEPVTPAGVAMAGPSHARMLANQIQRDLRDASILYGGGVNAPIGGGAEMAMQMTRDRRDSADPRINGPTRDVLDYGRRAAMVDMAVSGDIDIDLLVRMQQARATNAHINAAYAPNPHHIQQELDQVNRVLNGKIVRTRVPQVHAIEEFKQPKN